ncbi:MAG: hypothetical protein V1738_03895 [Patescibacteria group bacterium]
MNRATYRIAPLAKFSCLAHEYPDVTGDASQSNLMSFPHDEQDGRVVVMSHDQLYYGPVNFLCGFAIRTVSYRPEGEVGATHIHLAVYGRREGPRRRLRNGSWSVRVRPCEVSEQYQVASVIRDNMDWQLPIVVLVRTEHGNHCWKLGNRSACVRLPDDW